MPIHPSAHVDPTAQVDPTADIGPNVVIEGNVTVGPGTRVYANAYLSGWTKIGARCQIHPGAVVGHLPQDFHFTDARTFCEIGDETIIREFASVHRGTQPDSTTLVGKGCFLMAYCHVGHNCIIHDGAKVYNCAALSGHVEVGPNAIVSGYSLIHQFVRIGELAMIGGGSRIGMDVPPFMTAVGESEIVGVNVIGMKRAGYPLSDRTAIKEAHRILYRTSHVFSKAVEQLKATPPNASVKRLLDFLAGPSKRGFCGPARHRRDVEDRDPSGDQFETS